MVVVMLLSLGVVMFGLVCLFLARAIGKYYGPTSTSTKGVWLQGLCSMVSTISLIVGGLGFGAVGPLYLAIGSESWDHDQRVSALQELGFFDIEVQGTGDDHEGTFTAVGPDHQEVEGFFAFVGDPDKWVVITGLENY
jgi:hypothetical protein